MTVCIKDNAVSLDTALESLVAYSEAIDLIASHSRSVALEAIDIGKVKDTVVRAFKAFWERITKLYAQFVSWLKSKFGSKQMKESVATAKKEVNEPPPADVVKNKDAEVFEFKDQKVDAVSFIDHINQTVTRAMSSGADSVITEPERLRDNAEGSDKTVIGKIINYYKHFFICHGVGEGYLDVTAIADIASIIDNEINGARRAFFEFIKLPTGTELSVLERKIKTFEGLGLFDQIMKVLGPYVSFDKSLSKLMAVKAALPQISKITEADFSKIKSVKKELKLDTTLINFLTERSNESLARLDVTIKAYSEISEVINEQADEFQSLKPEVIMPGSTMEEVRPYINSATSFSSVQTALTKLILHQYNAELALLNSIIDLRSALFDKVANAA